jgi:hypothetical protein
LLPPPFVAAEVLEESEERTFLIQDLRNRIIQRTAGRGLQQRELLETVFREIDTDGSGEINRSEFKSLLVRMDMGYSGKKFTKLYSAIDRNGDGSLSLTELNHLLFPQDAQQREVQELGLKVQSRLDRRISALENEQLSEADSAAAAAAGGVEGGAATAVTGHAQRKRLGQISSLKSLSEATWKQMIVSIPEMPPEQAAQQVVSSMDCDTSTSTTPHKEAHQSHQDQEESPQDDPSRRSHLTRAHSLPPLPHKNPPQTLSHVAQPPPQGAPPRGRVFSSPKHVSHLPSPSAATDDSSSRRGVFSFRDPVESTLSPTSAAAVAAVSSQRPQSLPHAEPSPIPREPRLVERAKRHLRESQAHLHPRIEPDPDAGEGTKTATRRTAVI